MASCENKPVFIWKKEVMSLFALVILPLITSCPDTDLIPYRKHIVINEKVASIVAVVIWLMQRFLSRS